ncbi:CAP domain-containing protein [Salinirubellus sp. GCM10025818]|uniref:CAP domain-containing protein n=1 Tax=Salinirubellus TaxID=2162630 RepID=UPI0030D600AE
MPECAVCGVETSVTASCPHCATPVCAEHRGPSNHDCPGVDADRTGGWVIDLDTPTAGGPSVPERVTTAWRDLLYPSRSGAWLAAGTAFVVVVALLVGTVLGPTVDTRGAVVASDEDGGDGASPADRLNATRIERLVAERTNAERAERRLDPLAYDRALARAGEAHSRDMRERGFVGHENPDDEGLAERYASRGIDCPGGENVYYSPNGGLASTPGTLADHVVDAWMDSEGHRAAILKGRFTRQGVGVVVGPDGGVWVTQEFC